MWLVEVAEESPVPILGPGCQSLWIRERQQSSIIPSSILNTIWCLKVRSVHMTEDLMTRKAKWGRTPSSQLCASVPLYSLPPGSVRSNLARDGINKPFATLLSSTFWHHILFSSEPWEQKRQEWNSLHFFFFFLILGANIESSLLKVKLSVPIL